MLSIRFMLILGIVFSISACSSDTMDETIDEVETPNEEEPPVQGDRPNILLIIADDMGVDATPSIASELNATKPVMPTLSNLMDTELVFDNLWSYALCSPTRASILTGKHGFSNGVLAPIRGTMSGAHKSIHSYLDEQTNNAYAHAVFGKWHLGAVTTHPTQTMGVGTYSGNLSGGVSSFWDYSLVVNEEETISNVYSTTQYTQLAIDWKNEQTKPWFIWLAYNAAHTPFHRPDNTVLDVNSPSRSLPDYVAGQSAPLPYYLAMLEAMDFEMGRLINGMSETERENTVIIFIGDNGSPKKVDQYPGTKHGKGSIYQGGVNVPLVISGNGVRLGREESALLNTTDLFATIAEIAGVTMASVYHHSQSFKDLLYDENATTREFVYVEVPGDGDNGSYAVRNADYKLIHEIDSGREEMYHIVEDANETNDLLSEDHVLTSEEMQNLTELQDEGLRLRNES